MSNHLQPILRPILTPILDLMEIISDMHTYPGGEALGTTSDIGGIPTAITEQHNEVFYYWQNSGFKDAILFHVDGHSDMHSVSRFYRILTDKYYNRLGLWEFICAGVHYGIVSSVYWLNPHSDERRLQYLGSTNEEDELVLRTVVEWPRIEWVYRSQDELVDMFSGKGKIITPEQIYLDDKPLILDIDLDAFCCHLNIDNSPPDYDGVSGYERRILETLEVLKKLADPNLITITRSQGQGYDECVPSDKVDAVQDLLMQKLTELYGN